MRLGHVWLLRQIYLALKATWGKGAVDGILQSSREADVGESELGKAI